MYTYYNHPVYHRLDIRIACTRETCFDAWPGAIIRNNFLHAAAGVRIENTGQSLMDCIHTFPLPRTNRYYNSLKNGFPSPYLIVMRSHNNVKTQATTISEGEIISFSIILIGNIRKYYSYFVRALSAMCEKGLGHPQQAFVLVDVTEHSPKNESHLLYAGGCSIAEELCFPVSLNDFMSCKAGREHSIRVTFETPVSLFKPQKSRNTGVSFQDKQNGFPSFYQLVRSATYRFKHLNILYGPDNPEFTDHLEKETDTFIEKAGSLLLSSAGIRHTTLWNTKQKGKNNRIPFYGYTGSLTYEGNFNYYLPLLLFMQDLGVGDNLVYGMGRYKIEINE